MIELNKEIIVRINEAGEITMPLDTWNDLDVNKSDIVNFCKKPDGSIMITKDTKHIAIPNELIEEIRKYSDKPLEEIFEEAIREYINSRRE